MRCCSSVRAGCLFTWTHVDHARDHCKQLTTESQRLCPLRRQRLARRWAGTRDVHPALACMIHTVPSRVYLTGQCWPTQSITRPKNKAAPPAPAGRVLLHPQSRCHRIWHESSQLGPYVDLTLGHRLWRWPDVRSAYGPCPFPLGYNGRWRSIAIGLSHGHVRTISPHVRNNQTVVTGFRLSAFYSHVAWMSGNKVDPMLVRWWAGVCDVGPVWIRKFIPFWCAWSTPLCLS